MSLKPFLYPFRLPVARLAGLYPSLEAAFAAHDYLYVTRFGRDDPELRGCALILLGNRLGGEIVLDRHDVRSGRAFLYRAFAAWQDGDDDAARRHVAEARAAGGVDAALDRLEGLMARRSFRVVLHSDFLKPEILRNYQDLPGIEMILTSQLGGDETSRLPVGQSLATKVPPGPPVDLVLVDDFRLFPIGVGDLGAPVVVNIHDQDWYYDLLDEVLPEVDWVSVHGSSDMLEFGRGFGMECRTYCHSMPIIQTELKGLARRFADRAPRKIDLLFTGGISNDFYRDKRQRLMGLALADPCFNIRFIDWYLSVADYEQVMRWSRFAFHSVRLGNYWANRCVDALAQGVLNLMEPENAFHTLFSQEFSCFQFYRNDHVLEDVQATLRRYDDILGGFLPQAPQLEAELLSLFPAGPERAQRYLRYLLFVQHVERQGQRTSVDGRKTGRRSVPLIDPSWISDYPQQIARLGQQNGPAKGAGRPGQWMRLAASYLALDGKMSKKVHDIIRKGLEYHPRSLPLHYTNALCLRYANLPAEADAVFQRVAEEDLILAPDDDFPLLLDRLHGSFWVMDARIRERTPELAPLVPERAVWQSYALAHRAEIALEQAQALTEIRRDDDDPRGPFARTEVVGSLLAALSLAEQSQSRFVCNDAAQRIYLRAVFALTLGGLPGWAEEFLRSYGIASGNDYFIFHDFAPMAVHLLVQRKLFAEAEKLTEKLRLFVARSAIGKDKFMLYPEANLLVERYHLAHGRLVPQPTQS